MVLNVKAFALDDSCVGLVHRNMLFQSILLDKGPCGISLCQPIQGSKNFKIIAINLILEQIEGVQKDKILGTTLMETFPGVREIGLLFIMQRVLQTGFSEYYPVKFYHDNQRQGWREYQIYRTPNKNILLIYSDQTEHVQERQQLNGFATFFLDNPHPVFRISKEGKILFYNNPSESILNSWNYFESQVIPDDLQNLVNKSLTENRIVTEEMVIGSETYLLSIAPFPNSEYVNIYTQNITERKSLEQTLRRMQKMEAVGWLASGISHDFNNTLSVINGFSYCLLSKKSIDPETRADLKEIETASR